MTVPELLRSARDLESLGHLAEADRLRWLAASVSSAGAVTDDDREDPVGAAVREAEAAGDYRGALALLASGGPVLAS